MPLFEIEMDKEVWEGEKLSSLDQKFCTDALGKNMGYLKGKSGSDG